MKPRRRNPDSKPSLAARMVKPALIGGVSLIALTGAYYVGKSAAAPPAPHLRAGAHAAFRKGKRNAAAESGAEGMAGDALGDAASVAGNMRATLTIAADAKQGRYLSAAIGAPGSEYALKTAYNIMEAQSKVGYWLTVAGSVLHNSALIQRGEEYRAAAYKRGAGFFGPDTSGDFSDVSVVYAQGAALLQPYAANKQIAYILGLLGHAAKDRSSYDTQKAAAEDKNVVANTLQQTGQDISDAGTKAANVLAWVGGVITGRAPIGANPWLFGAWKWGARAAVVVGGYYAARAYARPYVAAARETVERVTGGAGEAAEAIQNGSRAVRKMIGQ